jgi:hypothetical protein
MAKHQKAKSHTSPLLALSQARNGPHITPSRLAQNPNVLSFMGIKRFGLDAIRFFRCCCAIPDTGHIQLVQVSASIANLTNLSQWAYRLYL